MKGRTLRATRSACCGVAIAALLGVIGCGSKAPAGADGQDGTKRSQEAPPATAFPPPAKKFDEPQRTEAVEGLELGIYEDGRLRVKTTDRFGATVNATYQSRAYLDAALDVYARILLPDRAAGLRTILATLPAPSKMAVRAAEGPMAVPPLPAPNKIRRAPTRPSRAGNRRKPS